MPETITRFAPSPTGDLHLGHVHAAKVAHDLARARSGRFLLRFEDIDHTRIRPGYYASMEEDLRWLGLEWDGPVLRQSARAAAYDSALGRLKELDAVYPCFCTRRAIEEEIARITNAPHGPEGALYPGTCRRLSAAERDAKLAAGALPAWRLDATRAARLVGPLFFHDLKHGRSPVDPALLGDAVLARKDIGTSYHLAVVTDDAFQQVTHVTRGEDLLPSTHIHRVLQALLGFPEPDYLHHSLVLDQNGVRLAKRHEALSIRHLRDRGETPRSIFAMLPPA